MRIAIEPIAAPIGLPPKSLDDWKAVPDSFLPALVAAKRFIGQTASYRIEGHVAFLHHSKLYATNNQVVLEFDLAACRTGSVEVTLGLCDLARRAAAAERTGSVEVMFGRFGM